MRRNTLRLLACSCAMALGATAVSHDSFAQTNVPVTLTTAAAISATVSQNIDFDTWVLGHDEAGGDITLVLSSESGAITPSVTGGSQAVAVSSSPTQAVLDVTVPAATTVNVYAVVNDFADAGLTLSAPMYDLGDADSEAAISVSSSSPTAISCSSGANKVEVGGTVTVTSTPAADTAHTASFDLYFTY